MHIPNNQRHVPIWYTKAIYLYTSRALLTSLCAVCYFATVTSCLSWELMSHVHVIQPFTLELNFL